MKIIKIVLCLSVLIINSCKKKDTGEQTPALQQGITYPSSVYYGNNILSFPDSSVLTEGFVYEIGAILENDANLEIVITNYTLGNPTSGMSTGWFFSDAIGWFISSYDNNLSTQNLTSTQKGKIGIQIEFLAVGPTGKCRIDFYENGNSITRTKNFSWQ